MKTVNLSSQDPYSWNFIDNGLERQNTMELVWFGHTEEEKAWYRVFRPELADGDYGNVGQSSTRTILAYSCSPYFDKL